MKIRYFEQKKAMECWFACAMMVLDYYGKAEGKEYSELRDEYGCQKCPDPTNPDAETTYFKLMEEYGGNDDYIKMLLEKKEISVSLKYFNGEQKDDFHELIKNEIDNSKPVVLGLNWGETGGHYVVVYGISENDYLVLDPLNKVKKINISSAEIGVAILTQKKDEK